MNEIKLDDIVAMITAFLEGKTKKTFDEILELVDENLEFKVDPDVDFILIKKHCEEILPDIILTEESDVNPFYYVCEQYVKKSGRDIIENMQIIEEEMNFWYRNKE